MISISKPANFGKTDGDDSVFSIPPLLVAGGIAWVNEQNIYIGPTDGIPNIYAPGDSVKVADGDPRTPGERTMFGNSCGE